jgi:hypothetical protein
MTKSMMMYECISSTGNFDGHGGAPEQYRRHRPMQHVQGYFGSHWTPPSGNYLLHGGQDDSFLSAIQAKLRSKSGHQRNSRQILQNHATELRRACAELFPKLLLQFPYTWIV